MLYVLIVLKIHDGGNASFPLLHNLTGSTYPGYVVSSTNQMYLNFISNHNVSTTGYYAWYLAVESE